MLLPHFKNELKCLKEGFTLVAGCDEAGRGPMAGPVVAAACILDPKSIGKTRSKNKWYARVRDSKTIPETERETLAKKILENAVACGVGIVSETDVDALNIHHASLLAMRRAVEDILVKIPKPGKIFVLVDGRFKIPEVATEQMAIISGDALVLSIAAASIIAKTHRDAIMRELDAKFPEYGWKRNKGYNTREHQKALKKFGASAVHRKTFIKQG
ncbi:ribonuclease HII [Candidatus Nomurabacteria bacterium]|nr:ribonuclease HII [Candidatus Nomurabacteria bacterium]